MLFSQIRRFMTALLTRPIAIQWAPSVTWFKRDNKTLHARTPFILSSSSRGATDVLDPGEQRSY